MYADEGLVWGPETGRMDSFNELELELLAAIPKAPTRSSLPPENTVGYRYDLRSQSRYST